MKEKAPNAPTFEALSDCAQQELGLCPTVPSKNWGFYVRNAVHHDVCAAIYTQPKK